MSETENRRPLSSREQGWAQRTARWLVGTPVTPNVISILSMVFAAIGCAAFVGVPMTDGATRIMLLLGAALCCQLRLLCNLFDGMVAVEGGKQTADGVFWNEFPDRISDLLFLAGLGFAAGALWLGLATAALAVLTAYTRELGAANGVGQDFCGPMAKQHRMAVVTGTVLVAACSSLIAFPAGIILFAGLWVIAAGALITVIRRSARMIRKLKHP